MITNNRAQRRSAARGAPAPSPGAAVIPRVRVNLDTGRVELRVNGGLLLELEPAQAEQCADLLRRGAVEARRLGGVPA